MSTLKVSQRKNIELGDFLRTRRERLRPEDVGLPVNGRRRTPGLRREEVAVLAGVSVTWYTWLEQGREAQPSHEVLFSLAEALRLNPVEQSHLFNLAEVHFPRREVDHNNLISDTVLRQLIDQQGINPTLVVTPRWDVVAWNPSAGLMIPALKTLQAPYRNIVWISFTDTHFQNRVEDWAYHARQVLMQFRVDYGQYQHLYDFTSLIDELQQKSRPFQQWWNTHDVKFRYTVEKRIHHPNSGDFAFTQMRLSILGNDSGLRMDTLLPIPDTGTEEKLRTLLST